MRTRNFHGSALGQILLWFLPHYHQDGRRDCQEERIDNEKKESSFISRKESQIKVSSRQSPGWQREKRR
jgi:hypothetical protein